MKEATAQSPVSLAAGSSGGDAASEEKSFADPPVRDVASDGSIQFWCEACGKSLRVKARYAGWPTRCSACGKIVHVPGPREAQPLPRKSPPGDESTLADAGEPTPIVDDLEAWSNDPMEQATAGGAAHSTHLRRLRRWRWPWQRARKGPVASGGVIATLLDFLGNTLGRVVTGRLALAAIVLLLVFAVLAANWSRFLAVTHLDEYFGTEGLKNPVRVLEVLAEREQEIIDLDRKITDLESARRLAPERADLLVQTRDLVARFNTLPLSRLNEAERAKIERLVEQGEKRASRGLVQLGRVQRIKGVSEVLATSMRRRGLHEASTGDWVQPDFSRLLADGESQSTTDDRQRRSNADIGRAREAFRRDGEESAPPEDRIAQAHADLASPEAGRRRRALEVLAQLAPASVERRPVIDAIEPLLIDENLAVRQLAVRALVRWRSEATPNLLAEVVENHAAAVHLELLMALAKFDEPRGAEAIAGLLTSPKHGELAVGALGTMPNTAEDAVRRHLFDDELSVRQRACRVLAAVGTSQSLVELTRLRRSRAKPTRAAAERAIAAIRQREEN